MYLPKLLITSLFPKIINNNLFKFKKLCLKSKTIKGIKGIEKHKRPKNTSLIFGLFLDKKKEKIIIGTNEIGTK